MLPHGGNQQFAGKFEIFLLETAAQSHWIFDQKGDFIEQLRIGVDGPPGLTGSTIDLISNNLSAFLGLWQHELLFTLLQPTLGVADGKAVRRHEAVPAGEHSAAQVAKGEGNHIAVKESDNPVHGTCESNIEIFPAHRFLERDRADDAGQHFRKDLRSGPTFDHLGNMDVLPFFRLDPAEVSHIHPVGAGESHGGLGGVSIRVKSDLDRRPHQVKFLALLFRSHIGDGDRQAARGGVGRHISVGDTRRLELLAQQAFKISLSNRQKAGGYFFGSNFQKKFGRHAISGSNKSFIVSDQF